MGLWSLVAPLRLRSLPPLGVRWESWLMRGVVSTKPWKLPRSHTFLAQRAAMIRGVYQLIRLEISPHLLQRLPACVAHLRALLSLVPLGQGLEGKVGNPVGIWSLAAPHWLRSLPPLV